MATLFHDKIIHENIRSLAIFSRIFSYEFIMRNIDKLEAAFYFNRNNFICICYEYAPNKNLMIGFHDDEPNGCFIGYYHENGNPININGNHYEYISFDGVDNVRAIVAQNVKRLFDIDLDL